MEAFRRSPSPVRLLIFFSVLSAVTTLGPRCLQCDKLESLGRCDKIVRCSSTEQCVVDQLRSRTGFYYNVGCSSVARCNQIASSNVVGRRDTGGPNGDTLWCQECCQGDFCNDRQLCHDTSTFPGPVCFECDQVDSPENCFAVKHCQSNEVCYTGKVTVGGVFLYYKMGCAPKTNQCRPEKILNHLELCQSCCDTDYCNLNLSGNAISCQTSGAKAEITKPLVSLYKHRLDSATFHCEVAGSPAPSISWLKDGVPLTGLPSMCRADQLACLHDNNQTLELEDLDSQDSGNFTCVASNVYGSVSSTALLDVDGDPIVWMSSWTTPHVGDTVQIECHVTGALRRHQLKWAKKLTSLPPGSQTTDLNNLAGLTFTYTGEAQSGLYRCMDASSRNQAYDIVGVVHDLGILSCSSTFDQCPHVASSLCGGTCPAHCGYNQRNGDVYPTNTRICSHVSLNISFNGGQVLWEMQNSGDPSHPGVQATLLSAV